MKQETITRRVGSLIKVRPEFEERYLILHRHVFPEVLDRIRKSNIRNYSIFLLNGILFSYYEYVGKNYDADMKAIGDTVTKEWWKLTDPMQEPLRTRKSGEWWATMEPVFEVLQSRTPQKNVLRLASAQQVKPDSVERLRAFFKTKGKTLVPYLKKIHIANVHVYHMNGVLYGYQEYSGTDWARDQNGIADIPELVEWSKRLEPMRMVFHTN